GRRGPGPGELGDVVGMAFDHADSLWVFSDRRTVDIWSPSFEYVRTVQIDVLPQSVAPAWHHGGMLVVGTSGNIPEVRHRVRLLEGSGKVTLLEAEEGGIIAGDRGSEIRRVAATSQGYWVGNFDEYDLRHLSIGGDTIRHLDVQ